MTYAEAVCLADLRRLARHRLPRAVFDFIDGGAGDEATLKANQSAFADWSFLPRVAVDVAGRSTTSTILGAPSRLPVVLAPIGLAGLFWPQGEVAAARAAYSRGVPFCLSTNSVASIEELAAGAPGARRWFQLYPLRDRVLMQELVARAAASGCDTLVVTLDLPVQGRRERDVRNGFTVPYRPGLSAVLDALTHPRFMVDMLRAPVRFGNFGTSTSAKSSTVAQHVATLFDPSADWDFVARLRAEWPGRFALKGILHPHDARRAVEIGADAVIVSNHGGRQLDGAVATIRALPAVTEAVAGRAEVLLDGGIRRGTDILKAVALGASACMIGRGYVWGLASGGEAGVTKALDILASELDTALALLGLVSVSGSKSENLLNTVQSHRNI